MWLYLDELQFKFEFRSGRMIFGWVMALELVFFVQIFSCPDFFFDVLWDIDLIFGMWLYLDELQFKFEFRSGRMIFGWVMTLELVFLFKFEVVRTFLWRPLIFGMWLYLDELQFKFEFRYGQLTFGRVIAIELIFFVQILSCPDFFFYVLWYIDLIFGMWLYLDELQFMFEIRSGRMTFGWFMTLELVFLFKC